LAIGSGPETVVVSMLWQTGESVSAARSACLDGVTSGTPKISISPTSGSAGSAVTVSGTYWGSSPGAKRSNPPSDDGRAPFPPGSTNVTSSGSSGDVRGRIKLSAPRTFADAPIGQSLIDFTPRISNVGQVAKVAISFWVSALDLEFTVAAGWDWDRNALTLDIIPGYGAPELTVGKDANKNPIMVLNEPLSSKTAPRVLVSKLLAKLNNRLTGSGRCVGDPRIQAGTLMRLEGVGKQFGGLYRVTSATHSIDSGGYLTSFELRKEIWFGSIPLMEQGAVTIEPFGQHIRLGGGA
jgi:hypothetical protein